MGGSPGRLTAWTLVSRTRYALVWTGVNAVVVLGLMALFGSYSMRSVLPFAIPVVLISFLLNGWIWYPRAKRKLTTRPG